MSSVQYLTNFVSERLTAAVEEIVGVFKKCVIEYEEEISRQRRLLDIILKPEIKLHRTELPQQHVCKEEEEVSCPQPPHIKKEQEEITAVFERSDTSEDQTLLLNPGETEEKFMVSPVPRSAASEPSSHQQLLFQEPQSRDHTRDEGNCTTLKVHLNILSDGKSFKCDTCGKVFTAKFKLNRHIIGHTSEYICHTCGKRFCQVSDLKRHIRTHTGEKPYPCKICGKCFICRGALGKHVRTHTRKLKNI